MVKIAPSLLSANFAYLKQELDAIKEAGFNPITMMIVTNQNDYSVDAEIENQADNEEIQPVLNIAKLGV